MAQTATLPLPKVLVTARENAPPDGAVLETPAGMPNVQAAAMKWWTQVLVRGLRSYIQNVLGYLLGAGLGVGVANAGLALAAELGVPPSVPVATFLTLLLSAMGAAIGPTVVCLLQNAFEILTKMDESAPKMRA